MKRLLRVLLVSTGAIAVETALLCLAAAREVSMSLLAAGGALSRSTLLLAAITMIVRLSVRLILPGLVVYAFGVYTVGLARRPRSQEVAPTRPCS